MVSTYHLHFAHTIAHLSSVGLWGCSVRSSRTSASSGSGEEVKASLPGAVFKVEVSEGDTVAEGDVLVVLEAMKMEIEVKAPKAGTVQSILVAQGDKVVNGTPLVTIG